MSEQKRHFSLFPKTLEQCVEPLTRPVLKKQGLAGTRILTEWNSIVGPQLSRHTLPEKLSFPKGKKSGGTLTIACENGFATELQHMQPMILDRVNSYFGYQAVIRVTISHSFTHAPEPSRPPMQPTLRKEALGLTETVDDPELKQALSSLARTLAGENT